VVYPAQTSRKLSLKNNRRPNASTFNNTVHLKPAGRKKIKIKIKIKGT
jgi:hypothetical protein